MNQSGAWLRHLHLAGCVTAALSHAEAAEPKCGLSRVCPLHHYALRLRSGAASVVGPEICFEGKVYVLRLQSGQLAPAGQVHLHSDCTYDTMNEGVQEKTDRRK